MKREINNTKNQLNLSEEYEYCIERRIFKENIALHQNMKNAIAVLGIALDRFVKIFPTYTDHSVTHSQNVLQLCNALLKEKIKMLNADECYILAMACYLHDVGMCIAESDYLEFLSQIDTHDYFDKNPESTVADTVRTFHNELSGCFIKKYADFFEIPTEGHLFGIIQVSRGHRKTDIFDKAEYPDYILENGNTVHLSCLAAIIRLADELDVTVERNSPLLFKNIELSDPKDIEAFAQHEAIRETEIYEDRIVISVHAEGDTLLSVENLCRKINETLNYCSEASSYDGVKLITQKQLVMETFN